MTIEDMLKEILEQEEIATVSNAFGGHKAQGKTKSYSVAKIRDWLLLQNLDQESNIAKALNRAHDLFSKKMYKQIVGNLIRFSFLIELTNLTVGSTKMKTRWLPGSILMPQDGSFEPIKGTFEPGNDPRASC
ncbi:MAG: hypothetical protein IBX56_12125, partial [Methylomicrobium sp.]|nr:hypothetical protein [Methylomicrobium sp.]